MFQGWLNTRPSTEVGIFTNLFDRIFEDAYNYVVQLLTPKMVTLQCDYIAQVSQLGLVFGFLVFLVNSVNVINRL